MLTRTEERRLLALHRRKNREESGLFLAEGVRVIEELLASSIDLDLAAISPSLEDTPRGRALTASLEKRVRTIRVTDAELGRIAATASPQGVLAAAAIPRVDPAALRFEQRAMCLLLDAVQDPGNFGTLVRSADAFRAAAVIALPGTVDPWNPKSVRSAAGSSFRVPILQMTVADCPRWLRREGFRLYGADTNGEPLEDVRQGTRSALIVGNEGAGLSEAARGVTDALVTVPIPGQAESLNVAVAAGILLYLLSQER